MWKNFKSEIENSNCNCHTIFIFSTSLSKSPFGTIRKELVKLYFFRYVQTLTGKNPTNEESWILKMKK